MARIHELKCDCRPFSDLLSGRKTCEVRENDRLYEVDDILHLREGFRTRYGYTYTGRETRRIVTHAQAGYGLPDGMVVLSVRELDTDERPFAWYRRRSDGGLEGPIFDCDSRICDTRRSFWSPLFTRPHAARAALNPAFNTGDSHMLVTNEAAAGISGPGNACAYRETCRALLPQHGFEALPEGLFDQLLGATSVRDQALEEAAALCDEHGASNTAFALRAKLSCATSNT